MDAHLLEIRGVSKSFGSMQVVRDISLSLGTGEIGCLLGPSGCGKTTLLRIIAGFETIGEGSVAINGSIVTDCTRVLPPEKRGIGMVFQDYALFPHLSVEDNIGFGVPARQQKNKVVPYYLELVGLEEVRRAYPHELSGGQQQRVALARALAPDPALLLLDEPFSNLDVTLRERLTMEVRDILKESGTTALMVTHNQFEAFAVADNIGVVFEGGLKQWDSAYNIYHRPATLQVATFVGDGAIVKGEVAGNATITCGLGTLSGNLSLPCENGCSINLLVRPEDILHDDRSAIKAKVVHKSFRGPNILYTVELATGEECLSLVSSHHNHGLDEFIGIKPEVDNLIVFP